MSGVRIWRPKNKDYTVVGGVFQLLWCLLTLVPLGLLFASFMGWVGVIVGIFVSSTSGVALFYWWITSDKRKLKPNGEWS